MAWLETQPMRRFEVAAPPRDAVRFVIDHLAPQGFALETWDLDSVLAERGPWTGVILREGSEAASFFADYLAEVFPLALVLPWVRRQHGRVRLAVLARPLGGRAAASELICWHFSFDSDTPWNHPKYFTINAMEGLTEPLRATGLLLAGPAKPSSWKTWKSLSADHPLHPKQWRAISKEARRRGRRRQDGTRPS
ncbi:MULTISPECIES: hypothetical protein [unclassified Actinomyces]|uniref:hypothetical protein n=1 Tax=unclassified Actinomyces TaxID=2609248 RepID=UPI000D5A21AA|nr:MULTISPECIES: hypothetical protein [unclassified Actinomyces]RAX21005.1 hypothetical protein DRB07_12355 [Actinomyces sp. Z3]